MGWEYDRIMYGLREKPPNKIIFISSDAKKLHNPKWGETTNSIAEKIRDEVKIFMNSEVLYFNYHDMESCLDESIKLVQRLCKDYETIDVNISAGTTLLKMAMIMASQYYPINLFYVIPQEYTHPCEIITKGAKGLVELPTINLKKLINLSPKQKEIFLLIENYKKSFTQITKEYAKLKSIKLTEDKTKTLKSWLFYHTKKLDAQGLVNLKLNEKQLYLSLTKTGSFLKKILQNESKKNEKEQTKLKIKKKEINEV